MRGEMDRSGDEQVLQLNLQTPGWWIALIFTFY